MQATAWGQSSAKTPIYSEPLNFSAEKSNIQILPQKFEFSIVDAHKMKLGDILIDATEINLEFLRTNKEDKKFKFKFTWPHALLQEGQIVLFNNYGKALWSSRIKKDDIKVTQTTTNESSTLRTDLAELVSSDINIKLLDEMKYLPFLKFCAIKVEENTRLQLCSREFYFSDLKDNVILKPHANIKKIAELSINDKVIESKQVLIFLNDPNQNISLRFRTENGSILDFETRMKTVEFQDAFLSADEKTIQIKAYGGSPAKEDTVEYVGNLLWKTQIPVANPVIYLKAAGGIPMRQEFYIRGPAPKEDLRPFAKPPLENKTYSSSITIRGNSAENTRPILRDKNSSLRISNEGSFIWELKNLAVENDNKRYLSFKTNKNEFTIFHKVTRGRPFQMKFEGLAESSGLFRSHLAMDWWFQNFMWSSSNWSNFHWGVQVEQFQALAKKDTLIDYSISRAALLYRFTPGFNFVESSWGLNLPYQMVTPPTSSFSSFGFGFFYHGENPGFKSSLIDWFDADFSYFTESKTSTANLLSSYELSAVAYYAINTSWAFSYGLSASQVNFENGGDSSNTFLQVKLGFAFSF